MRSTESARTALIPLFLGLDNETLYSIPDLIERAERLGLIDGSDPGSQERMLHDLLELLQRRGFPSSGDAAGRVGVARESRDPAWLGLRWEAAVSGLSIPTVN